jgi:D-alanyl-lipoteichoic acid acyltransferase DltB (MBOAT superfamily)
MLFHSTEFLLFFAAFALLYWLTRRNRTGRNALIVVASYVFYGWWDWRFLGLLVISSLLDYAAGLALGRTQSARTRKAWLWASVGVNLSILGFFKYFGFFVDTFYALLDGAGVTHPSWTWRVILPVGISFYTFQTLSYSIDVYHRRIEPTRDLLAFLAYVAFFPQLVAGPIERAGHLLPQFMVPRVIRMVDLEEGTWLVLWGLFKKVVVADHLAAYAELVFDRGPAPAPVIVLGTLAFAGQIYGDFSGYSDIARGLARMLGFELMLNFNLPYAATSVREFWRRWHISLSTWLRDYLYIPLGGNRHGEARTRLHLLVTMLLGGLWHGASWNFVLWGAWHGILLVIHRWWRGRARARVPGWAGWVLTTIAEGYGWLLFRAGSLSAIAGLHAGLGVWKCPEWLPAFAWGVTAWWLPLAMVQLWQWRFRDLMAPMQTPGWLRWPLHGFLLLSVAAYWQRDASPFIYFQF